MGIRFINKRKATSGLKLFDTIENMQADPKPTEGDLALVYRNGIKAPSSGDTISSITPLNVIRLNTEVIETKSMSIGNTWLGQLNCTLSSTHCAISFRSTRGANFQIHYESSDGKTYNRIDGGKDSYEFGTNLTIPAGTSEQILTFFSIGEITFGGLYEYISDQYTIAKSQINVTSDYVYEKTFYGKDGVGEGVLQNGVINNTITRDIFLDIGNKFKTGLIINNDVTFGGKKITTLPFNLDTSNVTSMNNMFNSCTSLTEIPLFDTSNVTSMFAMFGNCTSLTTIPQLDTSNVTNMSSMFNGCTSLTEIPLLDTSNVTSMSTMFYNCTSLTTIPQLDTSKVTSMNSMFDSCTSLTEIPLFDTSNVTNMFAMFYNCTSLTNNSLNNIMRACINAVSYTNTKTLKSIGLTEAQANICKGLSNYSAFTVAGWATGY